MLARIVFKDDTAVSRRLQGVVAVVNGVSMKGRNGFGITSLLSDVLRDGPMRLAKEV